MSELLKRVKKEGNPLIDDDQVTFVWKGKKAPYLHIETRLYQPVKLKKVGKKLWAHTETILPDAYIEYFFATKKVNAKTIVKDPFNANTTDTGVGHDNTYFSMPEHKHTNLGIKRKGIQTGTISKHKLKDSFIIPNQKRDLWLYHPPTDEPVPLLVVLDGRDYKQRGRVAHITDNLIAEGRIQPIAIAMLENADSWRTMEYNQGDSIPMLIHRSLLPFAQKKLNLLDIEENQGAYGILGASMGGLMALYIGLRLPHIFGKVISQAGAFFKFDEDTPSLIHVLVDTLPQAPIKIWQDIGTYDFLYRDNLDMRQRLDAKGYDLTYVEYSGGHNYTNWRNNLPSALETMYGV